MSIEVVHIISALKRGGKERQLSIICKYSGQTNNRIIYYHEYDSNYINEYSMQEGVIRIPETGFITRLRKTIKQCKKLGADCIVTWGTLETVVGMGVSLVLGIPMINFSIRHGIRQKKITHFFRSFLLHMNKYVAANSIAGLRANNLGKGFVIYNGIENIPQLKTHEQKQTVQKERLGISDRLVLVSVANLVPYKDYMTVLYALQNLKKQNHKFFYIVIGDGPNRENIESTIELLGLRDDILLTGSISHVDYYLEMSDILIHSSLGEGCSNAILEGMKHGLPIIATRVGGTPEIVNESNSMLFEYRNIETLQDCIKQFFDHPEIQGKMGIASSHIIMSRFSVVKMITDYEMMIQAVITQDIKILAKLMVET